MESYVTFCTRLLPISMMFWSFLVTFDPSPTFCSSESCCFSCSVVSDPMDMEKDKPSQV